LNEFSNPTILIGEKLERNLKSPKPVSNPINITVKNVETK